MRVLNWHVDVVPLIDPEADVVVRAVEASDARLLERMMLMAGFPPGRPLPSDARQMPHVRRFLDDWGRKGDVGVVALGRSNTPVGSAWARVFEVPLRRDTMGQAVAELAIAVNPQSRGAGVGAVLLEALASLAASAGHRELSLHVASRNPARRLYERCGFELIAEHQGGLIMRRVLEPERGHVARRVRDC